MTRLLPLGSTGPSISLGKNRIGYGYTWANTLAYVDDVTINDYFENFEPAYSCVGFAPPLDTEAIQVRNNRRVLPFKGTLVDEEGNPVIDINPPKLECIDIGSNASSENAEPVADLLPAGKGTDGNQFELTGDSWQFNLKLWNFGPSTYECYMIPGNGYNIDVTCTVDVEVQD